MNTMQHEQLFTDLTSEQAEVIQGGSTISLEKVTCIKAGSDSGPNSDDLLIQIDDQTVWGPNSIDKGLSADLNGIGKRGTSFKVSLYDEDPFNPDDLIGSYNLISGGSQKRIFDNGDSKYELAYTLTF